MTGNMHKKIAAYKTKQEKELQSAKAHFLGRPEYQRLFAERTKLEGQSSGVFGWFSQRRLNRVNQEIGAIEIKLQAYIQPIIGQQERSLSGYQRRLEREREVLERRLDGIEKSRALRLQRKFNENHSEPAHKEEVARDKGIDGDGPCRGR